MDTSSNKKRFTVQSTQALCSSFAISEVLVLRGRHIVIAQFEVLLALPLTEHDCCKSLPLTEHDCCKSYCMQMVLWGDSCPKERQGEREITVL